MNPKLIVILGPTASGKTHLAVQLADKIDGEIISADSRQVYKNMNIGTGKDYNEYKLGEKSIPYHLIDICEPGEKYNLARFQEDFFKVYEQINERQKNPILCGGTGLYIQSVLSDFWKTKVPNNEILRNELELKPKEELLVLIPENRYNADLSSKKRLIRAIEIEDYLNKNSIDLINKNDKLDFEIFGLSISLINRRDKITKRLKQRLENEGLIEEVNGLKDRGLTGEMLNYYGLEYKYINEFLENKLTYNQMFVKLETEIHRFAKRQMTFFRSMEKKGLTITWIPEELNENEKIAYVINEI